MEMEIHESHEKINDKSLIDIVIPKPPPLPNFIYANDDLSFCSKNGSCSSLEAMEDDDIISDEGTFKSESGSFSSSHSGHQLDANNIYQKLLINLNEAYTSMKALCFDEVVTNHRPNIKECWMMYLKEFTEIADGMICSWINPATSNGENAVQKLRVIEWNSETMMATTVDAVSGEKENRTIVVPIWQLRPDLSSNRPMQFTLECFQLCRFFFEKVWFSWDTDDIVKFFEENLERRIQFLYDIENGLLSTKDEKAIVEMIRRSRYLERRIFKMETEDFEDGSEEELLELLELQLEQEEIGNKIKRMENPVWRVLMKKLELTKISKQKQQRFGVGETVFVVCVNSTARALKEIAQVVESKFCNNDVNLQIVDSLELALGSCSPEGTVFVTPGKYQISGLQNFEFGGRIVGIPLGDKPVILEQSEMSAIWLMMDLNVQSILYFENIHFMAEFYDDIMNDRDDYENGCKTQVGIMIKDGHLHLENCVIEGRHEQLNQECHEITHSAMVKIAEGGNGMFTCHKTQHKNIKCLYWKDGKNQQMVEKSINIDWKSK